MSTVPFWDTRVDGSDAGLDEVLTENPWDILYIEDERVPGIAKVKVTRNKDVDVKKPKGAKGATITFNGDSPADVDIEIKIWTPKQWAEFQEKILPRIEQPNPNAYPLPVQASHPELVLKRVKSLFFAAAPVLDIDRGIGTLTVKAKEWFPKPKPVAKKKPHYIDIVRKDPDKLAGNAFGTERPMLTGLEAFEARFPPSRDPSAQDP